ncbi:MAG: YihA family ribosome biosis GTP-binding protein [Ignavibacteria bacterium]|nr:YihA family ribosome biosis GTP-binding protein [Ignavibacteria bacterium]
MKTYKALFIKPALAEKDFPESLLPEIAFTGRSNVGKSSLLNSIVHRKNLARISSTPGKTKEINFFKVENKWIFADLPGFGYAAVSKLQRLAWEKVIYTYFESRTNLKLICLLLDSRHDPQPIDLGLIERFEALSRNYITILTKCDKVSKEFISERKLQVEGVLSNCKYCSEVLPYSSVTKEGRDSLTAILKRII